jgi:predicted dehydrogenase
LTEKTIGVAVHGAGDVSTQHVHAYLNNPHTKILAISSRTEESAKKLAEQFHLRDVKIYTDYEKLLEDRDVEIISICTPQHLHSKEVVKAAQARKHMLIEKPVAVDLADLRKMRDEVRKARVKTVVGFVLRWNGVIESIKNLLAKSFFGSVYYVEADYQSHAWEPVAERWEWMRSRKTGVSSFLVAGVHAIDMSRWLASNDIDGASNIVEVVSYSGGYRKDKILPPFEFDVRRYTGRSARGMLVPPLEFDGLEVMLVKFENGALGKISTNFDAVMPYGFSWQIYGDKGTCKNDQIWSKEIPGQTRWISIEGDMPNSAAVGNHPFQAEIDHLVDCVRNDKESTCNLDDAVNTHEAAFAAIISRAEGRPVKLPLP